MESTVYDILIKNTRILTEDYKIKKNVSIAVKDGMIARIIEEEATDGCVWDGGENRLCADSEINGSALGGSSALGGGNTDGLGSCLEEPGHRLCAREIIDGQGQLWIPGLTDGHMHTCQQLLRGKILDELPMIWTRIMLPFESALTPRAVFLSAALASLEMIKGGTTSFVDAGGIHMDEAAKLYVKSGLRGALTLSTMDDEKVPETMRADSSQAVSNLNDFYNQWNGAGEGRIQVYYSLRSLLSCSQDLILKVFQAASDKNAMVEAHMNEYPNEINGCLERFGLRPMEYLDQLGVLSERFLSAHSILLSEHEIELMKQRRVKAVHCPFSNCGKGVPNTPRLLESGVLPGLGTDGTAHGGLSLFQEMKIFRSMMNIQYGVPTANPVIMPAKTILSMAISGGASAMGMEGSLGKIKAGCHADLIAIDLEQAHLFPTNNLVHSLVESAASGDVIHSIINGKLVMKDRRVLTLDEEKIHSEVRQFLKETHMMGEMD